MPEVIVNRVVVQPDVADHEKKYPRDLCNTAQKIRLFEIITNPDEINDALVTSIRTGNSPITVYEPIIRQAIESNDVEPLSNHEKQFVGKVICTVMELNGFKKADKKQNFTSGLFKKSEKYLPVT